MKVLQINAVYGSLSTGTIVKNIQESCAENGIEAYVAFPKGFGPVDEFSYEIGSKMDHNIHALLSRIAGKQAYYSNIATLRLIRYVKRLKPECQACGTPVVTYDATGSKETVDGKCGFAIETGNVKALFEQTLAIKRIGKSHFSNENIAWIHDNFRKEEAFDNYIRLYNELYLEKQYK